MAKIVAQVAAFHARNRSAEGMKGNRRHAGNAGFRHGRAEAGLSQLSINSVLLANAFPLFLGVPGIDVVTEHSSGGRLRGPAVPSGLRAGRSVVAAVQAAAATAGRRKSDPGRAPKAAKGGKAARDLRLPARVNKGKSVAYPPADLSLWGFRSRKNPRQLLHALRRGKRTEPKQGRPCSQRKREQIGELGRRCAQWAQLGRT